MRTAEFFQSLYPFADCHGYFCSHDLSDLCLNLMADFLDSSVKIAAPFFLKKHAYTVVSFLINNSFILTVHNLIADVKKDKCHQRTFLAFLHIQLIHT